MLKKIHSEFRKQLKLVMKFSDRIEAELAKELLETYHIDVYLFKDYLGKVTEIFVNPYDYQKAIKLLTV